MYCLILNYQGSLLLSQNSLYIISSLLYLVNIFLNQFQSYLSSFILLSSSNSDILSYPVFLVNNFFKFFTRNGEGGIWTLAPVARPTPLAGAPLRPLEYFSLIAFAMLTHYTRITLILSITFSKFFNTFLTNMETTYFEQNQSYDLYS